MRGFISHTDASAGVTWSVWNQAPGLGSMGKRLSVGGDGDAVDGGGRELETRRAVRGYPGLDLDGKRRQVL